MSHDFAENRLQALVVERIGRKQDLLRGGERHVERSHAREVLRLRLEIHVRGFAIQESNSKTWGRVPDFQRKQRAGLKHQASVR
jgi:hypothetical protein